MRNQKLRLHWTTALGMGVLLTHMFVRAAFGWWGQDNWNLYHTIVLLGLWSLIGGAATFVYVNRSDWLRGAYWTAFFLLLAAPMQDPQSAWPAAILRQLTMVVTMLMFLLFAWLPRWVFLRLLHRQRTFLASPTAVARWNLVRGLLLCLPLSGVVNLMLGVPNSTAAPMWEIWSARSGDQRVVYVVEMTAQAVSLLLLLGLWVRQVVLRRSQRNAVLYGQE